MMLNDKEIKKLIKEKGIIENYINVDKQTTQNGFDLTFSDVYKFTSSGVVDFSNSERVLPECDKIEPKKENNYDKYGWWVLEPGVYKVVSNEKITLPNNMAGFALSRTTLLRMGVYVANGFWEAGFSGRSEALLNVENPNGIKIKENARFAQIAFFYIDEVEKGYDGIYKNK